MKQAAEYLEEAVKFYRMAAEATDPRLAESLRLQGDAYRKLADKRLSALPPINIPAVRPSDSDGPP